MKRWLIIAALLLGSEAGFCAEQYHNIGAVSLSSATFSGGFTPWQRTVAQLQVLTPKTTGQIVECSNCNVAYTICISTGSTAPYQWILSTGTACK